VASAALSRRHFASVEQTYQSGNLAYVLTDAQGRSAPGWTRRRTCCLPRSMRK
jgi:hypothetical protein